MSNKTIIYLSIAAIVGIFILLAQQIAPIFALRATETFVHTEEVAGVATIYKDRPFTLNFAQQSQVIALLNTLKPAPGETTKTPFPAQQIVIYRFNKQPLTIQILGSEGETLVLACAEWNNAKPLKDSSQGGELMQRLMETFDR